MRIQKVLSILTLVLLVAAAPASIATATCPHYQDSCKGGFGISGATFTAGGQYANCTGSNPYCAQASVGQNAAGETCKSGTGNFCTEAGFNTSQPYLELIINDTSVDAGVLTSSSTHVGTATFSVKTYLADGYAVTTSSPGPKNGSYIMHLLGSPTAVNPGTEQFGMNLAANDCPATAPSTGAGSCTSPATLGAGPKQVPDSTFSSGGAASGYDSPNNYQYIDGSTIANSDRSSGETDYTMSYIFNISDVTPGGTYTMNQSIIATSTF